MAKQSIFREFFLFIRKEKKWWLIPLVVILGALAAVVIFAESAGPLAPFIYPFL